MAFPLLLNDAPSMPEGGSAVFSPSDIVGLQLWLKADAITGLNDGDPVTTWSDQSGNGNDATQATAGLKPIYKVNIVNGKPIVRFDNVDDRLVASSLAAMFSGDAKPFTIFVVAKVAVVASDYNSFMRIEDSGTPFVSVENNFGANWRIQRRNDANNYTQFNYGTPDTNWNELVFYFDGSVGNISVDGQVGTPAALATGVMTVATVTVGNDKGGTTPANADIAEILVYNSSLSDMDRHSVETYLGDKYGISINF